MHPITLAIFEAFVARLAGFDWWYDYSDDGNVWRRGQAQKQQIIEITKTHPILKRAYDAYAAYNYTREGTYETRRPALEAELNRLREQLQAQQKPMPMAA